MDERVDDNSAGSIDKKKNQLAFLFDVTPTRVIFEHVVTFKTSNANSATEKFQRRRRCSIFFDNAFRIFRGSLENTRELSSVQRLRGIKYIKVSTTITL